MLYAVMPQLDCEQSGPSKITGCSLKCQSCLGTFYVFECGNSFWFLCQRQRVPIFKKYAFLMCIEQKGSPAKKLPCSNRVITYLLEHRRQRVIWRRHWLKPKRKAAESQTARLQSITISLARFSGQWEVNTGRTRSKPGLTLKLHLWKKVTTKCAPYFLLEAFKFLFMKTQRLPHSGSQYPSQYPSQGVLIETGRRNKISSAF